jgi:hypothetical protein
MITIQEILGTDSIAASRLTINSNFLLVENEINDLENTFNINVVTGSMDISQATSGQLKAKTFFANQATFPSAGTATVSIYGTGASAGNGSFSGVLSSGQISVSGTGTFNNINASGPAVFGSTARFDGDVTFNGSVIIGATGSYIDKNATGASGATNAFLSPGNGGGGITGTYSSPYVLTYDESVIFANCSYVSGATGDTGNLTGFYFRVATGDGGSLNIPQVPQGFRLTIVNTGLYAGSIGTGVKTPFTGNYYTGFNTDTNAGRFPTAVTIPANLPYKASVTLQWENRIGKNAATQNGSWVVISTSGLSSSDLS